MDVKEIANDINEVKGRVKSGRIIAHTIINYEELESMTGYEVADAFELSPNTAPEIAKGKATARQLKELGWTLTKTA